MIPPPLSRHILARRPTRAAKMCVALVSIATSSASSAATESIPQFQIVRFCEPTVARVVDGVVSPPIIFNRFTSDGKIMRLESRTDKDNRVISVRRVEVSDGEARALCEKGFPVDVLGVSAVQIASDAAERPKTILPTRPNLPTQFVIYNAYVGYGIYATYGSFWVPANMPSGHTYQVVDFTVTPSNYQNSGLNSHLAVSTLTVSDSNLDHDFDGKGAIFYGGTEAVCGAAQKTVLQSWAIQNYNDGANPPCGTYPGCSNPVFNGAAPPPWSSQPATCGAWDAATPNRFLVGSNISQESVYWRCQPGGACPEFVSPTVNSTSAYFRSGGAGVVFLHVLSAPVERSLTFTEVSSYTGP